MYTVCTVLGRVRGGKARGDIEREKRETVEEIDTVDREREREREIERERERERERDQQTTKVHKEKEIYTCVRLSVSSP